MKRVFAGIGLTVIGLSAQVFAVRPDTILSVLRGKNVVFVSTRIGLFLSNPVEQKWLPIHLPVGVGPGGCLNTSAEGTAKIYYSPPREPLSERNDQCPVGLGLWVSEDAGTNWKQVDTEHLFRSVLFQHDNVLYASLERLSKSNAIAQLELAGGRVMVSTDDGKTWQETEDSDAIPGALSLAPCLTNATHVCALGWSIRFYYMEYAPEERKWTISRSFMPIGAKVNPAEYLGFNMSSGTSPCCYPLRANLKNYYRDSFGANLQKPGIVIRPQKEHYQLHRGRHKHITVIMELLPLDPPEPRLAVPDMDSTQKCWGLKYIDPNGNSGYVAATSASGTSTVHLLRPGHPYRRGLDLETLATFDKAGVYQAAIVFDNSRLEKRNPEEWTGSFSGQPFEIVVADR